MISVIIPVYKVEPFLDRCIESVVNQTYKNLEILLINDGSPDNCPKMCEEWVKKDSRIKLLNKVNGGLSSARNMGLDHCTGDYIIFLDSDDYVDINAYQKLHDTIIEKDVDIVCCNFMNVDVDGKLVNEETAFRPEHEFHKVYDGEEYLTKILELKLIPVVWNRIYKRAVFDNHRFTVGVMSEDMLFFIHRCDKNLTFYDIEDKFLHYTQRSDSITSATNYAFFEHQLNNVATSNDYVDKKFEGRMNNSLKTMELYCIFKYIVSIPMTKEYMEIFDRLYSRLKHNKKYLSTAKISPASKQVCKTLLISPVVAKLVLKTLKKMKLS